MDNLTNLWNHLFLGVPDVIIATLILILAFISAGIVKKLVEKLMQIIKIDIVLKKAGITEEKSLKIREFVSKLSYLIVFILFLPGIFQRLGLNDVASPIVAMMNKFMVYLPNILAATVILIIGLFLAKTVKELLLPIFKKFKMDEYLKKIGFESKEGATIAEFAANTVYVLIIIPIVISALYALNIGAISDPAVNMLNQILVFVPRIVVAVVILFIGKFIANIVYQVLEKLLVSIGVDKFANAVSDATRDNQAEVNEKTENEFSLAKLMAYIVKYVIIIIFLVEAINVLMLDVLTNIGNAVIGYIPSALSAIIIIGACILVGSYVKKIILKKFPDSKGVALLCKSLIIVVGAFITLYQLGIAKEMINAAFIIILSALAVAFAISFGIGGREFATHMLKKIEDKIDKK